MPAITEILYALGLQDRVVGVTANDNYPPAAAKKERVGGFFINIEKVAYLNPDLVIMQEDAQKRDIERLKILGFSVLAVNPQNINGVFWSVITIGTATGVTDKAERLVKSMQDKIKAVAKRYGGENKPKVLVIVGNNPLIVVGAGTFIDDIISQAQGENIAADAKGAYPQISFEKLLRDNPDYLIIPQGTVTRQEMKNDPRWEKLEAVRRNRILFINADIISRPGPRLVLAVEKIARFIHEKSK